MKKIMKKASMLAVVLILSVVGIKNYSGKNNVHYKDRNYCFVVVYTGSGRSQDAYSGTMSCEDYERWANGDSGTVFVYTDNAGKYGRRINIQSITSISNYGDTPYAYD